MKFLKSIVWTFLLFFGVDAFAQIGRGCLVDGILYTDNTDNGNRFFYRTSGQLYSACGFVKTGNSANCRLYNSGNIYNNSSYTLYNDAFSNDWAEITNCPIDTYVLILMTFSLLLGYSSFFKNNLYCLIN